MEKIISLNQLKKIIAQKSPKQKTVLFCGTFDLFHYGHLRALQKASTLGDILIVKVNANKLAKKIKGINRPIIDEKERAQIISAFNFVDYIVISNFNSENVRFIRMVKPDIFVRAILPKETDEDRVKREDVLQKKYPLAKIVWLSQTPEVSTTRIISVINGSENLEHSLGIGKYKLNQKPKL